MAAAGPPAAGAAPGPWDRAAAAAAPALDPTPDADPLAGLYIGSRAGLFALALRCALLSVVTLGLYRFWERTRVRRFIWSATRPGGDPFEYTGTGLEKFIGFLFAVLILAVGLGLVQLALFFVGLSIFSDSGSAAEAGAHLLLAQGSLLLFLPLLFFARYRSRRYKLARTRWRGIRFALEPGAWGYTWRGCLLMAATVASLGLLWPLMTFTLERFRTERTRFGDARFRQEGRWTMLLPSLKHIVLGLAAGVVVVALAGLPGVPGADGEDGAGGRPAFLLLLPVAALWVAGGYVHYRVDSFRRLTAAKRLVLADGTETPLRLACGLRTGRVLRHLLLGGLAVAVLGGLALGFYGGLVASLGLPMAGEDAPSLTGFGPLQLLVSLLGVLVLFAVYGSLTLVFVTQPIVADLVGSARMTGGAALAGVGQGARDPMADADGFASALDLTGPF